MIVSTIRMSIPVDKHKDALSVLRSIVSQSTFDPGCISYSAYRDIEDENVLMIQSSWQDEEGLKVHICSTEYLNLLLVLEMSLYKPEVRFDSISSSTGIETIEKIRSSMGRNEAQQQMP